MQVFKYNEENGEVKTLNVSNEWKTQGFTFFNWLKKLIITLINNSQMNWWFIWKKIRILLKIISERL